MGAAELEVEVGGVVQWEALGPLDNFFCPLYEIICNSTIFLTAVIFSYYGFTFLVIDVLNQIMQQSSF